METKVFVYEMEGVIVWKGNPYIPYENAWAKNDIILEYITEKGHVQVIKFVVSRRTEGQIINSVLGHIKEGTRVRIKFRISGRYWTDKETKEVKMDKHFNKQSFNTLDVIDIKVLDLPPEEDAFDDVQKEERNTYTDEPTNDLPF
jgi:hypothetical protein